LQQALHLWTSAKSHFPRWGSIIRSSFIPTLALIILSMPHTFICYMLLHTGIPVSTSEWIAYWLNKIQNKVFSNLWPV
jgi:hypothetical protein